MLPVVPQMASTADGLTKPTLLKSLPRARACLVTVSTAARCTGTPTVAAVRLQAVRTYYPDRSDLSQASTRQQPVLPESSSPE